MRAAALLLLGLFAAGAAAQMGMGGSQSVIDSLRAQPEKPERFERAVKAGGTVNPDGTVTIRTKAGADEYDLTIDPVGRIVAAIKVEASAAPVPEVAFPATRAPIAAAPSWEVRVLKPALARASRAQGRSDGSLAVRAALPDKTVVGVILDAEGQPRALELPAARLRQPVVSTAFPEGSLRQRLQWSGGARAADGSIRIAARPLPGEAIGEAWVFDVKAGADDRIGDLGVRIERLAGAGETASAAAGQGAAIIAPTGAAVTAAEVFRRLGAEPGARSGDGQIRLRTEMDDGSVQDVIVAEQDDGRCCKVQFARPFSALDSTRARRLRTAGGFSFDVLVRPDGSAYLPAVQFVRVAPAP